jgi:HAD superfamily hydrolase (TIGR01509 family)
MKLQALLFDCDGVLAETERDGHRVAYNTAMEESGIDGLWTSELYSKLVLISGGKERLRYFFSMDEKRYPADRYGAELFEKIYQRKTKIFQEIVKGGLLPPRPGVSRLIKEAHDNGIMLFVCSTSHKESVLSLIRYNFGEQYLGWFTELFCGDVVKHKKPSPEIYEIVKEKYQIPSSGCCVVEDSRNGLLAAKGAAMCCVVTPSYYTTDEDFSEADLVVTCLGDPEVELGRIIGNNHEVVDDGIISIADIEILL